MINSSLFKVIAFTIVAVIALAGIYFNLKLLIIADIVIVLALLFLINRKK